MSGWFRAALALLALAVAGMAFAAKPSVRDPLPFEHDAHARVFRATGVACVDCHPVGLTAQGASSPEMPPPPLSSCHGCHLGEVAGAPRRAPSECATCHGDRDALRPASHDATWLLAHAASARGPAAGCEDCHTTSQCLDCHDRRGALAATPHPPGFGSFHGIEARLDPRACSTCHEASTCTTCHTQGKAPW